MNHISAFIVIGVTYAVAGVDDVLYFHHIKLKVIQEIPCKSASYSSCFPEFLMSLFSLNALLSHYNMV